MKNEDIEKWIENVKSKLFTPISQKQVTFLESTADVCLGGGARGGGKSLILAADAIIRPREVIGGKVKVSIDYPEYTALLIRRTYQDLIKNFKPFTDKLMDELGGNWVERRKCYECKSGAKVYLVHLDSIGDVKKYIGGNYHYIGIEEANQFPFEWIQMLRGSLRSDDKILKGYFRMTSNPGGIGNLWLKKMLVDKCPPKQGKEKYIKRYDIKYVEQIPNIPYYDDMGTSYQYVPFGVLDNPILLYSDPSYIRYLNGLHEPLRSMWLFGDWSAQVGQFFDWNDMYHIIPQSKFHLDLDAYTIYRAMDYGTSNPFACLWVAVDRDKNMIVFSEIVEPGYSVTPQAKMIVKRTEMLGLKEKDIFTTVADPAYWINNLEADDTPTSPANIYYDNGVTGMQRGINDRIAGAMLMRDLMTIPDNGIPRLRFVSNCVKCIDTFPSLISSLTNPEDVDTNGEDHAYDALRYLAMFVYPTGNKKEEKQLGWRDKIKEVKDNFPESNWAM